VLVTSAKPRAKFNLVLRGCAWRNPRLFCPLGLASFGTASLILFAIALIQVNSAFAGRAYESYGCVYVTAFILCLRGIEKTRPDTSDLMGADNCLTGNAIILWVPRHA